MREERGERREERGEKKAKGKRQKAKGFLGWPGAIRRDAATYIGR